MVTLNTFTQGKGPPRFPCVPKKPERVEAFGHAMVRAHLVCALVRRAIRPRGKAECPTAQVVVAVTTHANAANPGERVRQIFLPA